MVTIENAVMAIGFLKLKKNVTQQLEIIRKAYVDDVAECWATHLLPCEIAMLAKSPLLPGKY